MGSFDQEGKNKICFICEQSRQVHMKKENGLDSSFESSGANQLLQPMNDQELVKAATGMQLNDLQRQNSLDKAQEI